MLDNHGFDLWAGEYDRSVDLADERNEYPFAGYKKLMKAIYGTIIKKSPAKILDVGIGTGFLAQKLYEAGNEITGIDFSAEMLRQARARMPKADLIRWDFTKGLPDTVKAGKFDFIVSIYALHHLTDIQKIQFIPSLLDCVNKTGSVLIGDVAFQSRADLEACKASCGEDWDESECYFVISELSAELSKTCILSYQPYSHCAGVLEIRPLPAP